MRVNEMFRARMAVRHSSKAPTLSVMEKWMVVLTGATAESVHLCRWLAAEDIVFCWVCCKDLIEGDCVLVRDDV